MAVNIQVSKKNNENNMSILRRFTRRVQGSGIIPRVRSLRYEDRNPSTLTKKNARLKSIRRKEEITELIKLGKMPERGGPRR